jgi:aconitate hydratase A / 2-methylisocitrate dehydratase
MPNSFASESTLKVGGKTYAIHRLSAVEKAVPAAARLPFSLKILLENLLRTEDGVAVRREDIEALARWQPKAEPDREIAFTPSRVLLQDFTGVPCVVDLAAMRDAMARLGGDPSKINPLQPVELVIDHSVQVDDFGSPFSFSKNADLEFNRNQERYAFLRWGQKAFQNFRVVPPDTGIVHQVNLEYLARVVFVNDSALSTQHSARAYPDTLVGTDSHTTMINGLGVLGWGVGGIEAEAAMLGQPVSMLIPQVVGFRLFGRLAEGATATDLVLTVTEMLRKKGVVGKFVEFFGEGLASLPLADRATIANMAPEYGATCGIFPVDAETLRYLKLSGRPPEQIALVEAYMKEQGLFHTAATAAAEYSDTLELDLAKVEASVAGPSRPQDRIRLSAAGAAFKNGLPALLATAKPAKKEVVKWEAEGGAPTAVGHDEAAAPTPGKAPTDELHHGSVVIAAITSCTNTSNPSVMLAAGLLAKKAVERGLQSRPWVKTSLAPGSKVVTDYLKDSGLMPYLEKLRFHLVGYGCTTCIGNSGPLPQSVSRAIEAKQLVVAAVLSGNRNFEGRIQAEVRANYLMSPPLVVAYALAGRMDFDIHSEPLGHDPKGQPVYLKDIWPSAQEIRDAVDKSVKAEMFHKEYGEVFKGDANWNSLKVPEGNRYAWDPNSTYVKHPPYFESMKREGEAPAEPRGVPDITAARVLAYLGDSITTDHISPAGSIKPSSPAGKYLVAHGVQPADFNSYGARRGNHEVMVRGTFANVRLKNKLVPGVEGGFTRFLAPKVADSLRESASNSRSELATIESGGQLSIFDASEQYRAAGVPLIILAGKEYGSGSSRDWAAKGPMLLGVRAVIAESFERIHRSNLVGMGVLPLQFKPGETAASLGLTGEEAYDITGLAAGLASKRVTVKATAADGKLTQFEAVVRIDTPQEVQYYQHGGILQFVLGQLLGRR